MVSPEVAIGSARVLYSSGRTQNSTKAGTMILSTLESIVLSPAIQALRGYKRLLFPGGSISTHTSTGKHIFLPGPNKNTTSRSQNPVRLVIPSPR